MSWKSGSLNLLEPSGQHWTWYRTPLPFTVMRGFKIVKKCDATNMFVKVAHLEDSMLTLGLYSIIK